MAAEHLGATVSSSSSTREWEDKPARFFELDFGVDRGEAIRRVEAVAVEAIRAVGSGQLPVRRWKYRKKQKKVFCSRF